MTAKGGGSMVLQAVCARQTTLLSFLRRELNLSSGLVSRLKWKNAFLVNGQPEHTNAVLRPGDAVTAVLDEQPGEFPAEDGPIEILYEDEALLALDKPAGLLVHPSRSRNEGTLANRLAGYYAKTGQRCAVHPVTRLDRDTVGVALFAKNACVQEQFRRMLEAGGLRKTYRAAVLGGPAGAEGTIDLPVWRPPGPSLVRVSDPRGQRAVTDYRVLCREDGLSLLELRPRTGRTHQLRLHCLCAGFPILGDPQYATEASRARSAALGLESQQLAAARLEFVHPLTGAEMRIESRRRVWWSGSTGG